MDTWTPRPSSRTLTRPRQRPARSRPLAPVALSAALYVTFYL